MATRPRGHAPLVVGGVQAGGGGGRGHATLIDETTSNGAYCMGHATPGNARAPLAGFNYRRGRETPSGCPPLFPGDAGRTRGRGT